MMLFNNLYLLANFFNLMCTNKLHIKNPVKPVNYTGFDKFRLSVPCGNCPECRKAHSSDWRVRAYYEFQSYGRDFYFLTLTYNQQNLPYYKHKPCFDYNHIKDFFKRLRYHLGCKFRYLLACEYGGFLQRPHYHFLIFPEKYVNYTDFRKSVQTCWWYGPQLAIKQCGPSSQQMTALQAIDYVVGYTVKDVSFFEKVEDNDIPFRFKPRTQPSIGFGAHQFSQDELERGFIYLPFGTNGQNIKFRIPKYYYMKEFYDYSYNPETRKSERHRNERGVELSKLQHNRRYVYLRNLIFSSKELSIPSPLLEFKSWSDCIYFLYENIDDFDEYLYSRDFVEERKVYVPSDIDKSIYKMTIAQLSRHRCWVCSSSYWFNRLSGQGEHHLRWHAYEDILRAFDCYIDDINKAKHKLAVEKERSQIVKNSYNKLLKNHSLLVYLLRKNYDFEKIGFSREQINNLCRTV